MTLTCRVPASQPPLQKVGVQHQFCFFKDVSVLRPSWTDSPELRVPALTRAHSGSYWCAARTAEALKTVRSRRVQIHVRSECLGPLPGGRGA